MRRQFVSLFLFSVLGASGCGDELGDPTPPAMCGDGWRIEDGICVDLDECLERNGGCGAPAQSRCVNQEGGPPLCEDVDECLEDNGGCGAPESYTCVNLDRELPRCDFRCDGDYATLTGGVSALDAGGGQNSALVVHGAESCVIAHDPAGRTYVASVRWGDGRAVGWGHEGFFGRGLSRADNRQMVLNSIRWAAGGELGRVALEPGFGILHDVLVEEGLDVFEASPLEIGDARVYVRGASSELEAEEVEALKAYMRGGGGLVLSGQAWYWSYSHDDVGRNFPANQLLNEAGLSWSSVGDVEVGDGEIDAALPSRRLHARGALDLLIDFLEERLEMSLEEQIEASRTVRLAIDTLPIETTEYFFRADELAEVVGPVVITEEAPLRPAEEPIRAIVVRLDWKYGTERPAAEVEEHGAAIDFPGAIAAGAEAGSRMVIVDGTFIGRDARYPYGAPRADGWRSTGLYAPAGATIRVTAPAALVGEGLSVQIGCHSDKLWKRDEWTRHPDLIRRDPIVVAETESASPFGGPIYILVPAGSVLGEAEVVIDGGIPMPLYRHGSMTDAEFLAQVAASSAPWAEFATEKFIMTVPIEQARTVVSPSALMTFWDRVLDLDADLSGVPVDRPRAERFVLDRQISLGWMHSGYPLMAHLASTESFVDVESLSTMGDWGAFHELGHNHQWYPWVLPGTTEATVNLYSVYVFEELVGVSRGEAHDALAPAMRAARMREYLDAGAPFERWTVWTALETYLQLQEAFGWDFFRDLFREYRRLSPGSIAYDDQSRIDAWVERSAARAGVNLIPFYRAWGFPISERIVREVERLPAWDGDPMRPAS